MATKDYLHPRWQEKRLRIMERDGFACRSCGDAASTLHVHHRFYEKGGRIWDTEDGDLVTLCEKCHEHVEEMVRDMRMIGDKIALLEAVGIAPPLMTDRWVDVVNTAIKNRRWGAVAIPVLDATIVTLLQQVDQFEERAEERAT